MAFCNKIGNLLRQGAAKRSPAPVSFMLNYIRCMSSSKLFIGGFGKVAEARVVIGRNSGTSRVGYVNFTSEESASSALSAMDGQELAGQRLRVSYAKDRPSGPRGGGGSYDGGYGDARRGGGGGGDW